MVAPNLHWQCNKMKTKAESLAQRLARLAPECHLMICSWGFGLSCARCNNVGESFQGDLHRVQLKDQITISSVSALLVY